MKTSVSIPDPLFEQAEALAAELRKTRSQLYSDAIRDFVVRLDPGKITDQLNRVYADEPQDTSLVDAAARATLSSVEW